MKKHLKSMTCLLLAVLLFAAVPVATSATYATPRIVRGTTDVSFADLKYKNEGSAFGAGSISLITNKFSHDEAVVYHWEYHITQGYDEGAMAYDTGRFVMTYTDFGRTDDTQKVLLLDEKDAWLDNLKTNLEYTFTPNKATFSYTLLPQDIQWMNANFMESGGPNAFIVVPAIAIKKLDDGVEAQYCQYTYDFWVTRNGVEDPEFTRQDIYTRCIDKKTVEITEAVAPVSSEGVVGSYHSDPSVITYLDENQEAMVKLTLTRPVGVDKSGNNEVTITVPTGMT